MKNLNTEGLMVYVSMYMKYLDRQVHTNKKISGCPGLGRGAGWVVIANEYGVSF